MMPETETMAFPTSIWTTLRSLKGEPIIQIIRGDHMDTIPPVRME